MRLVALALALSLLQLAALARASTEIVVNEVELTAETVTRLTARYGVEIPAGHYWYDDATGLYGTKGGPTDGRILPGLGLGGPLRADASHGDTGVFVNGREIHHTEYAQLVALFGKVARGRYWLDAAGIGGLEGQPASFDLRALARDRRAPRGSLLSGYFLTGVAVIGP